MLVQSVLTRRNCSICRSCSTAGYPCKVVPSPFRCTDLLGKDRVRTFLRRRNKDRLLASIWWRKEGARTLWSSSSLKVGKGIPGEEGIHFLGLVAKKKKSCYIDDDDCDDCSHHRRRVVAAAAAVAVVVVGFGGSDGVIGRERMSLCC